MGAFVKSVADIEREHQEKSDAEESEKTTKAPKSADPAPAASPPVPATIPPKAPSPTPATSTPPAAPTPTGPPKPPAASKEVDADEAPVAESAEDLEAHATEAGALKKIHVKPPIVVRDFAGEIGLKPFKLISELMELGIFASMNQTIEESVACLLYTSDAADE